jgi:predicted  nucleic acid-binding Zn-ribbon protein
MGIRTSFACVESRTRADASTNAAAAGGDRAAVGNLKPEFSAARSRMAELRHKNDELATQLSEVRSQMINEKQQLEEIDATMRNAPELA